MKRTISALLAALMLLALTACGSGNQGASGSGDQGASGGAEAEETATVSGVVNRLGDFLVLLTEDGEYAVFDFGESVDAGGLEEGDSVTVTYTGELGSEDPAPVAVSIETPEA